MAHSLSNTTSFNIIYGIEEVLRCSSANVQKISLAESSNVVSRNQGAMDYVSDRK